MENQEQDTQAVQPPTPKALDPYELIKQKGGPSKEEIAGLKAQTPNGRIKIFTLDGGERIFLLRAVSLLEMNTLTKQLPRNADAETVQRELPLLVVSKCCVWTNTSKTTKVSPEELKAGAAGLPTTLYQFIEQMSDFVDPQNFDLISTDL